jgi:predicted  nucleic acid-binding Zn-ribbon protein
MHELLQLLTSLQECDDEIAGLRKQQDSIPAEILALEQALAQRQSALKDHETQLHHKQLQRKELEIDLEESKEKVKKYKLQLYQVKTNKEYTALLHEIKSLEETSSHLEDKILSLMEDTDMIVGQNRSEKEALAAERDRFQAEKVRLQEELTTIAQRLAEREQARAQLAGRTDPNTLALYERIARVRGGKAVVSASNSGSFGKDFCGGCYANLPPQLLNEIRRNERVITCESCGRILIWAESTSRGSRLQPQSDESKHG